MHRWLVHAQSLVQVATQGPKSGGCLVGLGPDVGPRRARFLYRMKVGACVRRRRRVVDNFGTCIMYNLSVCGEASLEVYGCSMRSNHPLTGEPGIREGRVPEHPHRRTVHMLISPDDIIGFFCFFLDSHAELWYPRDSH